MKKAHERGILKMTMNAEVRSNCCILTQEVIKLLYTTTIQEGTKSDVLCSSFIPATARLSLTVTGTPRRGFISSSSPFVFDVELKNLSTTSASQSASSKRVKAKQFR
jgi:hypothetical protein